jgi:hypothetical protein
MCVVLGWLEPLLARIVSDPGAVPFPSIEIIYDDDFHVGVTQPDTRAIFLWKDLTFNWEFIPEYEKQRRLTPDSPIRSEMKLPYRLDLITLYNYILNLFFCLKRKAINPYPINTSNSQCGFTVLFYEGF